MKFLAVVTLSVAVLAGANVQADEIVAEAQDNSVGALSGGFSGVLVGGALGGPLGALVGAGVGFFIGESAQQVSGLSQQAYVVQTADGEKNTVRSPNAQFHQGQQVTQKARRLHAAN